MPVDSTERARRVLQVLQEGLPQGHIKYTCRAKLISRDGGPEHRAPQGHNHVEHCALSVLGARHT